MDRAVFLLTDVIRFLRRLSAAAGWLALGLMALIGAADVVGTAFFNRPIAGAFELAKQGLVVVVFFGLLHTQMRQRHIVIDILTERLQGKTVGFLAALSLTATTVAIGLIAVQTWPLFQASWRIRESAPGLLDFPIWPAKALICIAALSATVIALVQTGTAWRRALSLRGSKERLL
jgi:TRAP-type transport system small permease protein